MYTLEDLFIHFNTLQFMSSSHHRITLLHIADAVEAQWITPAIFV